MMRHAFQGETPCSESGCGDQPSRRVPWRYRSWSGGEVNAQVSAECATVSTLATDQAACGGACPRKGGCDCPDRRDLWDVGANAPGAATLTIAVKVNVFVPTHLLSNATVNAQISALQADYDDWNLILAVDWARIDGTPHDVIETKAEVATMKSNYADQPDAQLNVYVSDIDIDEDTNGQPDFSGQATFPWEPDALTAQGGIIVDFGAIGGNKTTLTHEVGHALGLWHTHHGGTYGELMQHGACGILAPCDCVCYEIADGTDCDITGDFCCDTDSTPVNLACANPGGQDPCSQWNWGSTDYDNFMGYAVDQGTPPCRDHFSEQQGRRMHCWTCGELTGWLVGETFGNCCLPEGTREDLCEACCQNVGGTFGGSASDCQTTGACCTADGGCQVMTDVCCDAVGGSFAGSGSDCTGNVRACCLLDATCVETTSTCCTAQTGRFHSRDPACPDPLPWYYCQETMGPQP